MNVKAVSVLVVDDDRAVGMVLEALLKQAGYEARHVLSGADALAALASRRVDVVLSDVRMPGMDGMELLGEVKKRLPGVPVLLLTAHGTVPLAVEAMRAGAADFLQKPFDRDEVLFAIGKAAKAAEPALARPPEQPISTAAGVVVGTSAAMRDAMDKLAKAAASSATVLLSGESGTGKEVAAHELHRLSPRRTAPFVAVHCGALPENLLESELFGHERGAFTGAIQKKPGRFSLANGGTIFLDEIGDVPLSMQVKLLRVLQEREVQPLGAQKPEKIDVRVIAATHRDLSSMVAAGTFREDLYFRLNVIPLRMPSLRERPSDIPALAASFVATHAARNARPNVHIEPAALELIARASWPGNVRELQNFVERLVVFAEGDTIDVPFVESQLALRPDAELASGSQRTSSSPPSAPTEAVPTLGGARAGAERDAVKSALERASGNRTQAARLLGVSRRTLYNKLSELGLE